MDVTDRGLGRRWKPDEKDANYPLRLLLQPTAEPTTPQVRHWRIGPILDQGSTSQCVGYTVRQWLTSYPIPLRAGPSPEEIYRGAQQLDEWPGENYAGTSDRGAMKYLQTLGLVGAYYWATSAEEAMQYVLTQGGLLLGTPWLTTFDRPDPKTGLIKLGGTERGGHEIYLRGADRRRGIFFGVNSWGEDYGIKGQFAIQGEDVQTLLVQMGADVCCPVQLRQKRVRKAVTA